MKRTLTSNDLGLKVALENALSHPAPFDLEECQKLNVPLRICCASDLSLLQHCPNLHHLEIHACDVENLDILTDLEKLRTLKVTCSTVENIQSLVNLRGIENLDLSFTFIQDLSPLMGLPNLRRGTLLGNPWNAKSYNELRPKLLTTPVKKWQKPPVIEFSRQDDWELTRQLWDKELRACFGRIDDSRSLLVIPGIGNRQNSECDYLEIYAIILREALEDSDFTLESLFEDRNSETELAVSNPSSPFQSHRKLGDSDDAVAWVNGSKLSQTSKKALLRFIKHFPTLVFFKEDAVFLDRVESLKKIKLPKWLREIRQTVAYVMPNQYVRVQFDSFDQWSLNSDNLSEIWYDIGLRGVNNTEQQGVTDYNKLFPIGEWLETGYSTLAINLGDPKDQRVYEYDQENINDDTQLEPHAIGVVFNSYAEMFSHISAIQLENEEIIRARK
ncbi:MAG: hypothetical protein V7K41_17710 [Nostoc sp.]|uniref:hypothetical protein n=1 Tax=Nostoc sp. TaxID=1180 RepID=UPI002FF5343B